MGIAIARPTVTELERAEGLLREAHALEEALYGAMAEAYPRDGGRFWRLAGIVMGAEARYERRLETITALREQVGAAG